MKGSDIRGFLTGLLVLAVIAAVVLWRVLGASGPPARSPAPPAAPAATASADCAGSSRWQAAAQANHVTLYALQWSPFGQPESGWATYAPLLSREINSPCAADSPGFAEAFARWQAAHKRPADGVFKAEDFDLVRDELALRRPFVQQTAKGLCPAARDPATLATARPDEAFGGKPVQLRPGALEAYRRMVAAARAAGVAKPPVLQLVSGYRGPAEEAARCADGGCDSVSRASCSAHRSGLALDLYLAPAPGRDPVSTAEEDRRRMAASPEYRWLVTNAQRFGFLPYAYEPWHWEWTGEAP